MTRASDTARLIGAGATINDGTTITTADNTVQLSLTSTDADENSGPELELYRNSASPADNDFVGTISFQAENDAGEKIEYGVLKTRIVDASDGTEDFRMTFEGKVAGSDVQLFKMDNSNIVFNEDSKDIDFRVETDDDTHTLFVQGSSDNVGIGTASPDGELHIEPTAGGTNASLILSNDGRSQYYRVQNNETSDALTFNANDSTQIMQITGVNVGIFSTAQTARLNIESNVSAYTHISLKNNNSSNTSGIFQNFLNASGTVVGSISQSGTSTSFNTSSDYRLKENVTYDFDATTRLKQLKPCRFNFIEDDDNTTQDGFLAHEVSNVVPSSVNGVKDGTLDIGIIKDKDGKVLHENAPQERADTENNETWTKTGTENVYQGIDQSKLVPLLVKTVQELEARIATLESK